MKQYEYLVSILLYVVIVSEAQSPSPLPSRPPRSSRPSRVKNFHLITTTRTSWFKALHYCVSRGLSLASITSREENDRLLKQIRDAGIDTSLWIAGTKLTGGGKFYWMGHSAPSNFTNWGQSQPSDTEGLENCMELSKELDFKWNDIDCQHFRYFVCEDQMLQNFDLKIPSSWWSTLAPYFGFTVA